jgi:serine phosphatase RsbU (regulator of sigma subunit)
MSSVRSLAWVVAGFVAALAVSGFLYLRSRSADFDRHARAVEGIARVRHFSGQLSEQVLAARFGLLNQYDPITAAEQGLGEADTKLRPLLLGAVEIDADLEQALARLSQASRAQRAAVERFKAENSVLKNSLFYLPTAAEQLVGTPAQNGRAQRASTLLVQRVLKAALVYNLIGDQSTRAAYQRALAELEQLESKVSPEAQSDVALFKAHAHVIADRQTSVDGLLKQVAESSVSARLSELERGYAERFSASVAESGRYRKILYGWSLFLLCAVVGATLWLRGLYQSLEQRVAERTAELSKALAALWGEMKLARKIQEALVPARPTLDNCEMAARMKATDEVGGDYYDVVRLGGSEWILIGDVSGHGVPAGLIMMMCHTAVRTLLRAEPSIDPDRLLAAVNTVLTENIRQLGEDKYMTISAFRREPDGTVLFAGAHQDVVLYRARENRVEALETSGLWLGLREQISHTLTTRRFRLGEGDLLVLYTDGITEAVKDGRLFDMSGVKGVVAGAQGKSADQVLSDLFEALEGFEVKDDATVLVLKQLGTGAARALSIAG